eukprot:CAMPEP_0170845776 /NCGR_PEP_ID=MMETSP0734-20130129/7768_1 /TAXON_ID=186038 /ORGANISM="Fragilariopsis kerguelensis, Strain L26-C5" /LENGTH=851 /DNA_ID=CAMNT_0011214627 /DNA_START=247 /DNA_END=2802 /DNA_ORIENTATION=+
MSGINSFIPLIPEDVKSARIGSGFDTVTGKLKSRAEVFHLGKLNRADLLEQIDGSLTTKYHVDQSSSDIQSNSFFGSDTEAKTSFWCVSASVGASMDKEKAQANSSFSENLVLQSLNTGGYMLVRGVTSLSDDVYNCTFDAFKDHYDPIMKATTTLEYFAAYENFSKIYGDSCVTKVHLIAGSALQITLRKEGSSQSSNAKYGASASVSTPLGGVSDAQKWGNGMKKKHAGGTMDCTEVHFPMGKNQPPTFEFIHAEYIKRVGQAIDTLQDKDEFLDPNVVAKDLLDVTAPEIEEVDLDETKEAPEKALPDDKIKELEEKDEKEQQIKDGDEDLNPEEYRKKKLHKTKKLKNNTTKKNGASNVVKEGRRARKKKKKYGLLSNNNTILTGVEDKSSLYGATPADYNGWDTGGFWVNGFETTKWTALFPQLKRTFPQDDSTIFIARAWLYLLTRIEFLEYLKLIIDVGDDIAYHWGKEKADLRSTMVDARIFSDLCDYLKKKIAFALDHQSVFSQVDYLDMIVDFNEKLDQKRDDRSFSSMKVYDTFFDNYDVFHNNPLGFVQISHTVDGDEYTAYTEVGNPTIKQSVGKASLPTLLTDARRCYPVINVDGNTVMVAYHRARIGPGQFVVVSPSSAWDKGDIVAIRSSYTVTENRPAFLDSEKDSGHAFLHFASNQNKDTRQWKFEKIGDNYAIKNIGTGKYLEARPSNQTRDVLVTDRTPTSTDTSLLWHVDTSEYDSHYFSQIPPMLKNISSQCWLSWVDKNDIPPWMSSDVDGPTHWYLDSDPGNFFQDFHKDPNDKLGLEAYISSDQRTTFVGLNYEHRHLNDHIMVGVPFLSRLPFDEIVSPLHPEDA